MTHRITDTPMGLTGNVESETLVQQTYNATYGSNKEWSKLSLEHSSRMFGNDRAYSWLLDSGWIEEKRENGNLYCKLTQVALDKLKLKNYIP